MIKHVGFPKCVNDKPFTLVHSPAELREWEGKNQDIIKAQKAAKEAASKPAKKGS